MGRDDDQTPDLRPVVETIRAKTKLLRSIIESIGDGLVVADNNGKFLIFNKVAEQILGTGATDVSADQWSAQYGVFHADGVTPCPSSEIPLSRAIRGEECDQVELFIRNANVPNGVAISVTGRPLLDDDGAIQGGVVVFRTLNPPRRS